MVQRRDDVVLRMRVGVARAVLRHVGGRKAARVEGDAAEAAREEAQLRLPAAVVAGELVHEHERRAAAALLEIQAGGPPPPRRGARTLPPSSIVSSTQGATPQ